MKTFKKNLSRIPAFLLTLVFLTSIIPCTALATAQNTMKEEVIYINLFADGSVKEINAVNIFDLEVPDQIIDYGNYESVRNMTGTEPISYSNNTTTIQAPAGKLYYEGKLKDTTIPWNISIRYFMDGKEYAPDQVAGMSGKLKISISITENKSSETSFFADYALQAIVKLDTKKCSDIIAENATIANVGSLKQLTYTILPGKGADIEISANVSNFSMESIAINGIPLNLNIDINEDDLFSQVNQLLSAIRQLDSGANELQKGVNDLHNGAKAGIDGVDKLQDGATKLQSGIGVLEDGTTSVQSGANHLKDGIDELEAGINELNNGIIQVQAALNTLHSNSPSLVNGSAAFYSGLTQLQDALNSLTVTSEDLSMLKDVSNVVHNGLTEIVNEMEILKQDISTSSYITYMANNGANIDSIKQNNSGATNTIQSVISALNSEISVLEAAGHDTSNLRTQIDRLQGISNIITANNAAYDISIRYVNEKNNTISSYCNGANMLVPISQTLNSSINDLVEAMKNMPESMGKLSSAVDTLVSEYKKIDNGIVNYTNGVAEILTGYNQIVNGSTKLLNGSASLKSGATDLYSGTADLLSGIVEIHNGAGTLRDASGNLNDGVEELLAGIIQLYDGTNELKDGTYTVKSETSGMNSKIKKQINNLINSITGDNITIQSFTSKDNVNIDSVQFVIKTEAISIETPSNTTKDVVAQSTFWDKLVALFKK